MLRRLLLLGDGLTMALAGRCWYDIGLGDAGGEVAIMAVGDCRCFTLFYSHCKGCMVMLTIIEGQILYWRCDQGGPREGCEPPAADTAEVSGWLER